MTGKLLVSLNPSDLFKRLAAAVVAGDINALVIEHKRFLSVVKLDSIPTRGFFQLEEGERVTPKD